MKILLGADQYPEYINGAATFTARLATGLARAGHTVDLLWPSAEGNHHSYVSDDVRVHRLSSITLPGRPRMQVARPGRIRHEIDDVISACRPDVIHVQSHLVLGRSLVRAARERGIPLLATNHFMPENLLPHLPVIRRFPASATRFAWHDLERVFGQADLITAPTRRAVDLLAATTRLPPAEVVSCGLDLERYRHTDRLDRVAPDRRPTVLFVGRLEPEKHVEELISSFARLPVGLDARLVIVGMGSLRARLEDQARATGRQTKISFTGAVSDHELLQRYARADLFVMPGRAELQSLATLEAMAAGLPVVAANAMALPHLVRPQVNGYLYEPGDAEGLSARMERVLGDVSLQARLGLAGRRIAEQHSLAATISRFEDLYTQLATRTGIPVESGPRPWALAS